MEIVPILTTSRQSARLIYPRSEPRSWRWMEESSCCHHEWAIGEIAWGHPSTVVPVQLKSVITRALEDHQSTRVKEDNAQAKEACTSRTPNKSTAIPGPPSSPSNIQVKSITRLRGTQTSESCKVTEEDGSSWQTNSCCRSILQLESRLWMHEQLHRRWRRPCLRKRMTAV